MTKLFTMPELPQTRFLEGEQGKTLPPLEGREIITRHTTLGTKESPQKEYYQRYTNTIQELTVLVERLLRESNREIQKMRRISSELQFYWELPEKVSAFMADIAKQVEEYRNAQIAQLEHVSQVLDELLEGKAKPSGDMMKLILDAIEGQKTRLETLENKVATMFSLPAAQGGSTARSGSGEQ